MTTTLNKRTNILNKIVLWLISWKKILHYCNCYSSEWKKSCLNNRDVCDLPFAKNKYKHRTNQFGNDVSIAILGNGEAVFASCKLLIMSDIVSSLKLTFFKNN